MIQIRATHPAGFRSGTWAALVGVEWANGRPCFRVAFDDGKTDSWVIYDRSDPYEFREVDARDYDRLAELAEDAVRGAAQVGMFFPALERELGMKDGLTRHIAETTRAAVGYHGPERRVKDDPLIPQWEERRGR